MTDAETLDPTQNFEVPEDFDETTEPGVDEGVPESGGDDNNESDEDEDDQIDEGPSRWQRFKTWYLRHKKKTIPVTVALLLGVIFGVPASRYGALGLVLRKTYVVSVTDGKSNLVVSEAEVEFRGKKYKTNAEGKAILTKIPVGKGSLKVTKKYYQDYSGSMLVPLDPKADFKLSLTPTGRQVPIKAVNKITGKPLAGAVLSVAETQVKTDERGEATVVLPPEKESLEGIIRADNYNEQKIVVEVSHLAIKKNTFNMTPAGKLYYLSKRTGKINVMKADLDGNNVSVVLEATGNESESDTVLLASRDWKYLALKSRRTGAESKLYLIETSNDKLTEIDGGDGTVTLVGWSEHRIIYQLHKSSIMPWQSKRSALKSYDGDKKQGTLIEETIAEGVNETDYLATEIQAPTILSDRLLYNLIWVAGYVADARLNGKKHAIISIKSDAGSKQTLKDFDAKTVRYINVVQSEVGEVYYRIFSGATNLFYTFNAVKLEQDSAMNEEMFYKEYPTYLVSPSSESTVWYEQRDGKNTLIVGDAKGGKGNEVVAQSEYTPYGWYTDNYILVSKGSSELYILPSNGIGSSGQIIKITDYHKPAASFKGYGYGYGGL